MSTVETIERVVAPAVTSFGLELVDVELQARTVRLTVDRPGGVDLDSLGALSAEVSRALDVADAVPGGRYELEVSSPGVERRLRRREHFVSQIGNTVALRTKPGVPGERRVEGVLVAASAGSVRLESDAIENGAREVGYADIERAHTVFDWRAALAGRDRSEAR